MLLHITVLCLGAAMTEARPHQQGSIDGIMKNGMISLDTLHPNKEDDLGVISIGKSGEYFNLLDAEKWKELLAQGKVRDMIDTIQKALGSERPVRVRTQWGGKNPEDWGNSVRNTINWNAYEGDKSNLNLIMDSKFVRNHDKVDMVNPNLGMHFELKY